MIADLIDPMSHTEAGLMLGFTFGIVLLLGVLATTGRRK